MSVYIYILSWGPLQPLPPPPNSKRGSILEYNNTLIIILFFFVGNTSVYKHHIVKFVVTWNELNI